jgi:predicted secreted protein
MKDIDILTEIIIISQFLANRYDHKSGEELMKYLTTLNNYMARLPELEAEAEYNLSYARGAFADIEAKKVKKDQVSVTLFKEIIGKETANQSKIHKFVDRLNKSIQTIQKGVITQISYEKAQSPSRTEKDIIEYVKKMGKQMKELSERVINLETPEGL